MNLYESIKLGSLKEAEEVSFEEIIRDMENAEDYEDLYNAADKIVDIELRSKVKAQIKTCEEDKDPVDVAYSVTTSDLLDMKVNDLNEASNNIEDWDKLEEGLKVKCKEITEVLSHYGGVKHIDYSVESLRIDFSSEDFAPDSLSKYSNSIEFGGFIYFDKNFNVIKTDVKTASGPNLLNREFISALNALYTYTHSNDGSYEA